MPGANGQGETIEGTKNDLRLAIELILEGRKADILRGLPEDAIQDKVLIGWKDETWNEGWELQAATLNGKKVLISFGLIQKMGRWKLSLDIPKLKSH